MISGACSPFINRALGCGACTHNFHQHFRFLVQWLHRAIGLCKGLVMGFSNKKRKKIHLCPILQVFCYFCGKVPDMQRLFFVSFLFIGMGCEEPLVPVSMVPASHMPEPDVKNAASTAEINYQQVPAFDALGQVQVVVEIPAGTNKKIEYDYATNTFPADQKNGADRRIDFLPYPANYGFVPSTYMDTEKGGDGDALDVLLLSESLPAGSVVPVLPIALMELEDGGEKDNKLVAIPADAALRIIAARNFGELRADYPGILTILEKWFLGYKGPDVMVFKGWQDEKAAMADVYKWQRAAGDQ